MKQLATQVAIAIQQSELYTELQQLNTNLENTVQRRTQELAKTNQALKDEIIERQRTEQALRTTNHTLQSLIAASPRAIFTLDLEERVKIWNPAAERMFGWTEAEIYGKPNPVINTTEVFQYHEIQQKILQGITPPSMENSTDVWQDTNKRSRNLRRIQNSVKNMVQLLDDILTINRAETGKLEFNPKLLRLEKLCSHCVEEIQLSAGSKHQIIFDCPHQGERVSLEEKLMRSIIANLLSNAIKYSPQGGEVRVSLKFFGDRVQLKITDQGIGISEDDLGQLFEPFHRGQNVRRIPGTGLGLIVVKKCVDLHHGRIDLNSKLNVGTVVTIEIPLRL